MRWLSLAVILLSVSITSAQNVINNFAQPVPTTVQLPTFGVAFDADGVLQMKTITDPTGQLMRQRAVAAVAAMPADIAAPNKSRKVSLVKLEKALAKRVATGQQPTKEMQKLAGLVKVDAIFCYPDTGDIVLQGPAEGWMEDLAGRAIGIRSRRPTLLLEDLVTALRAFAPRMANHEFVGCTINPRPEGLAALQQFQRKIPSSVSQSQRQRVAQQVAMGVQQSLGMADVQVFGISSKTHFASVMIEADYRMKRIAVGIEPPPVKMVTFANALSSARIGGLQRWWFTPAYEGVKTSPDRLAMQLTGQGVQLQTEDKVVLASGAIVDSGRKPSKAMLTYANSFTRKYPDIAAADPVYGQLRQLADWLILAAYLKQHRWYDKADWQAETFMSEERFAVKTMRTPKQAPVVVNAFWKGNRMFSPAGGGVSMEPRLALQQLEESSQLNDLRAELDASAKADHDRWWWD